MALDEIPGIRILGGIEVRVVHLQTAGDRVLHRSGPRIGEIAGMPIHGRPRTHVRLYAVQGRRVRIRTTDSKLSAVGRIVTRRAQAVRHSVEPMLDPAHPDLLKSAVVQTVGVLDDDGVLVGTGNPVRALGPDIARRRADGESSDIADAVESHGALQDGDQHVRPGGGRPSRLAGGPARSTAAGFGGGLSDGRQLGLDRDHADD